MKISWTQVQKQIRVGLAFSSSSSEPTVHIYIYIYLYIYRRKWLTFLLVLRYTWMPSRGWASANNVQQANPAKAINYFEQFAHQLHSTRRPTLFSFHWAGMTMPNHLSFFPHPIPFPLSLSLSSSLLFSTHTFWAFLRVLSHYAHKPGTQDRKGVQGLCNFNDQIVYIYTHFATMLIYRRRRGKTEYLRK